MFHPYKPLLVFDKKGTVKHFTAFIDKSSKYLTVPNYFVGSKGGTVNDFSSFI